LKVLILSHRVPYPPNKGEKLRTYHQIKHFINSGHNVCVCTPVDSEDDLNNVVLLEKTLNISVIYAKPVNHALRLIKGLLFFKPLSVSNFYCTGLQKRLDYTIKNEHYDAILCTSSSMAEYIFKSTTLPSYRAKNKLTLIMDFMDLDSDKWRQYSCSSRWPMSWVYKRENRFLSNYELQIQQAFDHCFFISQNEVDLFHKLTDPTDNVRVLGNGIDTEEFYPANTPPNNTDPVFIFTGVMDYKPNIEAVHWFVDNAWELITSKYPHSRFIIAGMNPVDSIVSLCDIAGIEITGFVEDMLPYYHTADYFVAPFTIARGVQNKILQAFACGLPVITTSMGAEGISCTNGKDVMIAQTGNEFLEAIVKLQENSSFKYQITSSALHLIKDVYSWEGQLKPLDTVLYNHG